MRWKEVCLLGMLAAGCGDRLPDRGFGVLDASAGFDAATPDAGPAAMGARLGEVVQAAHSPPPVSGGTLLVMRDGRTVVATDPDRDRVWITDLLTRQVRAIALSIGDEPGRLTEGEGGAVWVALRRGGAVLALDIAGGTVSSRHTLCPAPRGLAWDDGRHELVVACAGGELVSLPRAGAPRVARIDDDLRDVVLWRGRRFVSRFRSAQLLEVSPDGEVLRRDAPDSPRNSLNLVDREPGVAWRTIAHPTLGVVMLHQSASTAPLLIPTDGSARRGGYGQSGGRLGECTETNLEVVVSTFHGASPRSNVRLGGVTLAVDIAAAAGESLRVATPGMFLDGVLGVGIALPARGVACARVYPIVGARDARQGTAVAVLPDGTTLVQTRDVATLQGFSGESDDVSLRHSDTVVFPEASVERDTGHMIFHVATPSGMACASCHPEGGEDGRVWLFRPLGQRRTPSLRGATSDTAPFHWDGDMRDVSHLLSDVMTLRMSAGPLSLAQHAALSRWIDALPIARTHALADAATLARGRQVFEGAAGCADCHSGDSFTNNEAADVGTGGRFQVPQLRGLAMRAPYLHDGRATSLDHRLMLNDGDRHGHTSTLTGEQRADLVAYLRSL